MKVLDFFDKAWLINLDTRPERLSRMTERMSRVGLKGCSRYSAICPPKGKGTLGAGAYGLALTHKALFDDAIKSNIETLLLLEDDTVFRDDLLLAFKPIPAQINKMGWDVLFLGHRIMGQVTSVSDDLVWTPGVCQTHMVAFHCRAFEKLRGMADKADRPVDLSYGYARHGLKSYCTAKLMAVQEPGWSDIAKCAVASWKKCLGWQEFSEHCSDPILKEK